MNRQEAIAFSISSARTGVDQINDPTLTDAVASYRDNVIDTLADASASEHTSAALEAFDAEALRLKGAAKLPHLSLTKAQAEAVYSAMCALNNIGGRFCAKFAATAEQLPGPCYIEVEEKAVGEVIIFGRGCEIYADQSAFATAYGLAQ